MVGDKKILASSRDSTNLIVSSQQWPYDLFVLFNPSVIQSFSSSMPLPKIVGLLVGPLLFGVISTTLSIADLDGHAIRVIAVAAWLVVWWMTEAVPLPVTALLPLVLFPLLGIFSIREAAAPYASPIVFLFMGGFIIALAMEKRNLHRRIALNLIRLTGT